MNASTIDPVVRFDGSSLAVEQIDALARAAARIELSTAPGFVDRIDRGARFLERLWQEDGVIYGVTTGYLSLIHI